MGNDPKTSVLNQYCQAWDVKNLFVTDGAPFVSNADKIAQKRNLVQRLRRRADREIFARFPLHLVPTYPGDESLMSSALFRLLRPPLPSVEKNLGDIMQT